jgi:hypothetical protein
MTTKKGPDQKPAAVIGKIPAVARPDVARLADRRSSEGSPDEAKRAMQGDVARLAVRRSSGVLKVAAAADPNHRLSDILKEAGFDKLKAEALARLIDLPGDASVLKMPLSELPTPSKAPSTHAIEQPTVTTHGPNVVEQDGKILMRDGSRYFPLALAAQRAQTSAATLLNWIKKGTEFAGEPLQSYYFAPANQYFISEEAIQRAADRFMKWPSQEPARNVTLGETNDGSGYIAIGKVAEALRVTHTTVWNWIKHETAPIGRPLDVIKCTAPKSGGTLYIRESDVADLKKSVPRSGLRPGRRPQLAPS